MIDRTEAMTVVDVNTGKFTGSGGNLEETVTKNNLEAAEEIVRQLRLRDIGGIIVVDFIDMVLESNRDLVLRRLVECLGRDRTRHQVAEVTSLGLVQMTRKRIGTGLLESFSHDCTVCHGRGVVIEEAPGRAQAARGGGPSRPPRPEPRQGPGRAAPRRAARSSAPSPKDIAAMARHERAEAEQAGEQAEASADAADVADDGGGDRRGADERGRRGRGRRPRLRRAGRPSSRSRRRAEPVADAERPSPRPPPTSRPSRAGAGARADAARRARAAARRHAHPSPGGEPSGRAADQRRRRPRGREAPRTPPAPERPSSPSDETPALHVPVKRKGGARKR